ncbi:MAG: hypothetical protein ACO3IB_14580, partial [Phycisphaerales bacterium]
HTGNSVHRAWASAAGASGKLLYLCAVLIEFLVETVAIYAALGLAFSLAFVLFGAARIDPVARQASFGFRVVALPGAALFWPYLALRWWRAATGDGGHEVPGDRTATWQPSSERMRLVALGAGVVLAPLIAAVVALALGATAPSLDPAPDAQRLPRQAEAAR